MSVSIKGLRWLKYIMANIQPKYTTVDQVKLYLRGKTSSRASNYNEYDSLTTAQIKSFIVKGESRVEIDLSRQYNIPLVSSITGTFEGLPDSTQIFINEMCTWRTLDLILTIMFGSSDGVRGKEFRESCVMQYKVLLSQAKGLDKHGQYIYPPLQGLLLNPDASYRTVAGAQTPKVATVGVRARDLTNITRGKLSNMNKSLVYGWLLPNTKPDDATDC